VQQYCLVVDHSNLLKYLKEGVTGKTDDRVFDEFAKKQSISNSLETFGIYDYTNKTSLSQAWNILNKSTCVVTMDSGILHLAGTTDTHILQLGSSIPLRKFKRICLVLSLFQISANVFSFKLPISD
jgi:hypothetical protein